MYEGCTYKSRVSQVWASGLAGFALSSVREGEDSTLWRDAKVWQFSVVGGVGG